jgi:hypothetical protein
MSLNAAIEQKYIQEVQSLSGLLLTFIERWRSAQTEEKRSIIESDAVELFERILALDIDPNFVKPGDNPNIQEFVGTYEEHNYVLRTAVARLQSVARMYLQHYNSQQIMLMELIGKLKRIKQKKAALSLWTKDKAKFVFADRFLNYDFINEEYVSLQPCDIDTNQGILTLPVRNKKMLDVAGIRVGSGSNGKPGNSDVKVTVNNISPDYVTNGNPENWFEYERLDAGPCELSMVMQLKQESIINNITIEPVNLGNSINFDIEDIIFATSSQEAISVKDLLSGEFDKDFFTVKSVGNDTAWSITFVPTFAKTVTLKFKQSKSYQIPVVATDGREILRKRYAIAIKEVALNQLRFEKEGGIGSTEISIPTQLYACVPFLDVWPRRPSLFDIDVEVSFDGGENWMLSSTLDDGVGETLLKDGNATSMIYRLKLVRENDNFDIVTSLIEEPSNIKNVESVLTTVSRFSSPARIPISERPLDDSVFVLQPKVARRGDKYKTIRLGEGTGTNTSFELSFDLLSSKIDPDLVQITVNGRTYNQVPDNSEINFGEWAFTDDYREIEFGRDLPANARVEMFIEEELMHFEERSDGYYHKMGILFDPDKENMSIEYLPRRAARVNKLLPKGRKVIPLGVKAIESNTFQLLSELGTSLTEVSDRSELVGNQTGYFVDYASGVLHLGSEIDSDTIRTNFAHRNPEKTSLVDFDIVYEDGKPWGVRIQKEAFAASEVQERIGDALAPRINVVNRVFEVRRKRFPKSPTARRLSHGCIVMGSVRVSSDLLGTTTRPQEIEYIDGKTEFLGLIGMDREETSEIVAGASGIVAFNLAAGALWYEPFDLLTSDTTVFSTKKASVGLVATVGDYYVDSAGTVTVYVGASNSLPSGIALSYYYRDPDSDPKNKFSVDYEEGIIYSDSNMQDDATISYRVACYKIAYDLAEEISSYEYDTRSNTVSVRTEGLRSSNSLVKVVWSKAKSGSRVSELKDYFSPIISVLAFRYT